MGIELDSFDDIIEIDDSSTLLLRVIDQPWKKTLDVIQVFKSKDGITFTTGIKLPLDQKITYYLSALRKFVDRNITSSLSQIFRDWANRGGNEDPLELSIPRTPPDVLKQIKSNDSTDLPLNLSKSRLAEITPLVDGTNRSSASNKKTIRGKDLSYILDPTNLDEKVAGTKFTLNDLIHSIVNNQPFSNRIDVPDEQVKQILFYAFMGKRMITMNIEKEIMRHNIYYNYTRTGRMLREMADQGLVEMEERIAKKSGFRYYLWKFTCGDDPKKRK